MEFIQDIFITGIIMPNNWDENGKVTEIAIYTNTEEIYVLEDNSLNQKLFGLLQKKVELRGKIRLKPDGNRTISAHN
jgi:hypothetical protein